MVEGNGALAQAGERVVVHYEARWKGVTFMTSRQGEVCMDRALLTRCSTPNFWVHTGTDHAMLLGARHGGDGGHSAGL